MTNSSLAHIAPIHILDDDSLLNVFYLYRPFLLGEDKDDNARLAGGYKAWIGEHWWFKLAHICQRWRNLILGSRSYLGLCLVCTNNIAVADILAYSPPLPLILEYLCEDSGIGTGDNGELMLALEQRERVHRIRLMISDRTSQKLITAMNGEFPILEYLIITSSSRAALILPKRFQAPSLRQIVLIGPALPIRSQLFTATVGLVTLSLTMDYRSTYLPPTTLLQWLSCTPQLETLRIFFAVPNYNVERKLTRMPITTQVTLPNLRWFVFQGVSAYSEGLFRWISSPRLEKFQIFLFPEFTFSIPYFVQFINTTRNLRFSGAKFRFSNEQVHLAMYPREGNFTFWIVIICKHLELQVRFITQIYSALSRIFSAVDHLALEHSQFFLEEDAVDSSEWHRLLRSFNNVKTLCFDDGLFKGLSRCLQPDNGVVPDLLPELQELTYAGYSNNDRVFTSFIDIRQNTGRPVTLVRRR